MLSAQVAAANAVPPVVLSPPPPGPVVQLELSSDGLVLELPSSQDGAIPTELCLIAAGVNRSVKGDYVLDEEAVKSVMARAADYGNDYCLDYGHAMLDDKPVDPALAGRAAAFYRLQVIDGALWTKGLRWTEEAKSFLRDKQYRFLSPAFRHKKGRVLEYVNAALTNIPATKHQPPIVQSLAPAAPPTPSPPQENTMKLVLQALGLADTAGEADALSSVTKLQGNTKDIVALTGAPDIPRALGVLHAWKEAAAKLPAAEQEIEKLKVAALERKVRSVVNKALLDKRLPPSMKEKALKLGSQDLEMLQGFLDAFKPLTPKASNEKDPADAEAGAVTVTLTKGDREVAKRMGLKLEDFAKTKSQGLTLGGGEDDIDDSGEDAAA